MDEHKTNSYSARHDVHLHFHINRFVSIVMVLFLVVMVGFTVLVAQQPQILEQWASCGYVCSTPKIIFPLPGGRLAICNAVGCTIENLPPPPQPPAPPPAGSNTGGGGSGGGGTGGSNNNSGTTGSTTDHNGGSYTYHCSGGSCTFHCTGGSCSGHSDINGSGCNSSGSCSSYESPNFSGSSLGNVSGQQEGHGNTGGAGGPNYYCHGGSHC